MKLVLIDPNTQVVVPREPTWEMDQAGIDMFSTRIYRRMVKAAPEVKVFELPERAKEVPLRTEYSAKDAYDDGVCAGYNAAIDEFERRAQG